MKNKVVVSVILVMVLLAGCGSSSKQALEEQKKQEEAEKLQKQEQIQNIYKPIGTKDGIEWLKNAHFKSAEVDSYYVEALFTSKNIVTLKNSANVILTDISGEYSVDGNNITIDCSKQINARKTMTVEDFLMYMVQTNKLFLNELKNKLKDNNLSDAEKKEIENKIKEAEEIINMYSQPVTAEMVEYVQPAIERAKQYAVALESINPIRGVLNQNDKTLVLKKVLKSVNNSNVEYIENITLTLVSD